jgi:Protein of unknown function (DUF1264)
VANDAVIARHVLILAFAALAGCGGGTTKSSPPAAGAGESAKTRLLESGAALLQEKAPLDELDAYLDGFHFYNGSLDHQVEAHHYCGHLNENLIQCVIYDGNAADARLMGIEYVVTGEIFARLPDAEKHMWHSHVHEVRSGQLIAPGLPDAAERELMEKIANTYGKTWHTWQTDMHADLPLGTPQLMMGFTADGQTDPALISSRDQRFGVSSDEKRRQRVDIKYPRIDRQADAWQKDIVLQIVVVEQQPSDEKVSVDQ